MPSPAASAGAPRADARTTKRAFELADVYRVQQVGSPALNPLYPSGLWVRPLNDLDSSRVCFLYPNKNNKTPNMLACHVTIVHELKGPSNTITCADASSHLAIGEAFRTIQRGKADLAICGGADPAVPR